MGYQQKNPGITSGINFELHINFSILERQPIPADDPKLPILSPHRFVSPGSEIRDSF
jgi:hypothetical protein